MKRSFVILGLAVSLLVSLNNTSSVRANNLLTIAYTGAGLCRSFAVSIPTAGISYFQSTAIYVVTVTLNGNLVLLDHRANTWLFSDGYHPYSSFNTGFGFPSDPQSFPFTYEARIEFQQFTVVIQATCLSDMAEPIVNISSLDAGASDASLCPLFKDGRLNDCDAGETAAVYCQADGSVKVLAIYKSRGYEAFVATPDEIAKVSKKPTTNTVIKSGNGATLYRLRSGELQVNRPEDGSGKMYKFIFNDCPVPQK